MKFLRADVALTTRGFFESRAKARAAIEAGCVFVDGLKIDKPSHPVNETSLIEANAAHPWVSRGGLKLVAALDRFGFDVNSRVCLDVGASTGGFTEVLLSRGAKKVFAVDVGHGQLHSSLRRDPRVAMLERMDARHLTQAMLVPSPSFIVCDVSFISQKLILPNVLTLAEKAAALVTLIKPQFEVGRGFVHKGVVRSPALHERVCHEIQSLVVDLGWRITGMIPSPISGGDGNIEFLLGAVHSSSPEGML